MTRRVNIEVLAVGSELLTPYFRDTNSLYLSARLEEAGLSLAFKTTVGDDRNDLLAAAKTALRRSSLVIAMGGLGPTEDDRTREVFAAAMGRRLVLRKDILASIRARFNRRGRPMPPSNHKQAYILEGAEVLDNPHGTAPGLWVETGRRSVALLPGPPREFEAMLNNHILPRIVGPATGRLVRRVLKLTGLGESAMESRIRDLYRKLPPEVSVTTLACPGELAIHIICRTRGPVETAHRLLDEWELKFRKRLDPFLFSSTGLSLEEIVVSLLAGKKKTVACAESCSGGLLSNRLTNVPGSSDVFLESVVAYSNSAKVRRLGVPARMLARDGAVSPQVARAMAAGIRSAAGSDYGLSITGIAGPGGGTVRKPVGLVYTALAGKGRLIAVRNLFWGGRDQVKFQSSQKALDMLRKELLEGRE